MSQLLYMIFIFIILYICIIHTSYIMLEPIDSFCFINKKTLFAADLAAYITKFQWDMAKYPIKQSLRNIADIISKQVSQIDADLKTKSTAYNNLKSTLQNMEKKQRYFIIV